MFRPAFFVALAIFVLASGEAMAQPSADYKIGQSLMQALTDDADATAPFFVFFAERANLAAASRIPDWAARGSAVVMALQSVAGRSQAGVRGYLQSQNVAYTPYWVMNAIYIPSGSLALARTLSRRPEVAAILPERVHTIPPVSIQEGVSTQAVEWNISRIGADSVWATTEGEGIVVANIDTGVRYTHEALEARYGGLFYDPTGTCGAVPCDNNGHGTHTMGTMVGGNGIGVAPGAKWIACKGCASSSCYDNHLISCAQWMLEPAGLGSSASRPHVVNNSWGGPGGDDWYSTYVGNWREAGIFPAFSAGNSGPACSSAGSPGDYSQSFASGATDINEAIASFSSRGPSLVDGMIKPDVSAPGVNILSSYNSGDSSYATASGTSMASPHTAGTVALLWAAQPALVRQIDATEQRLQETAVKYGTRQTCGGIPREQTPNNTFGYGRIDAYAAAIGSGPPPNQAPVVTITSPSNGASFNCEVTVTFTGTATDEDAGLSELLRWSDDATQFAVGATVSKLYSCTETGSHTITARVTDSGELTGSSNVTIYIVNPATPAAPSLSYSLVGTTVHLTWDNVANETGYRLERKKSPKGSWEAIPTLLGADVTFFDDTPGAGTWQYRVQACNVDLCSAYSNIVTAKVGRR